MRNRPRGLAFGVLLTWMLASCGAPTPVPPAVPATPVSPTATMPQAAAPTQQVEETAGVEVTQEPAPFPLSSRGPYYTGRRQMTLVDDSRNGRQFLLDIWYPALKRTDASGKPITRDAEPDRNGAPYPLILTGAKSGSIIFESHLVSHGFVMGIVRSPDSSDLGEFLVIDMSRDLLYALDQIASHPPEGLEGVIDSDQVGVSGFSGDGDVALALSGVRVNPEFYLSQCEQAPAMEPPLPEWWIEIICSLAQHWDALASYVGQETTTSDDGLWQAMTDERIRAVVPMAPSGWWLYGEPVLAAADRPVRILWGTADDLSLYDAEAAPFFDHLGTPERYMVSLIGSGHGMPYDVEQRRRMNHFATAFFGTYLQGKSEYRDYFSEDFHPARASGLGCVRGRVMRAGPDPGSA